MNRLRSIATRFAAISAGLEAWWVRSAAWVAAAVVAGFTATVMFALVQYQSDQPPLSLVAAVHGFGGAASIQYAVLDGYPFVRVRYPKDTVFVGVSDLWSTPDSLDEPYSNEPYRGMNRFFGNTLLSNFAENVYLLLRRWFQERASTDHDAAGIPEPDDPFPETLRQVGQANTPLCMLRRQTAYRFDFSSLNAGLVKRCGVDCPFGDANDMRHLEIRNGSASRFYVFKPSDDLEGPVERDLWCELRAPATAQSLIDRSLLIVNGIGDLATGALPLRVEPPLVEPQWGGQARDVSFVTENADPNASSAGMLPPGGAMLLSWTDGGYSRGYRDFLLLLIGALYGLAVAMGLEAVRPLFDRRSTER